MDKTIETIAKSKALELAIHPDVAKAIIDNWFKYTREIMKSADPDDPDSYKNIRWINFGIIYSDKHKREGIKKKFNLNKKDE
jgi:hypothetical protein